MRFPTLVRPNARYRGPIESHKFNKMNTEIEHGLHYLYQKLGDLKEETTQFLQESVVEMSRMSASNQLVHHEVAYLRGGESRV